MSVKIINTFKNDFDTLILPVNKDGKFDYRFMWLDFKNIAGEQTTWDNPDYVFNQLYDTLYHFIESKDIIDNEEFKDICINIPIDDFKLVFDMLEFGIKLGFKP